MKDVVAYDLDGCLVRTTEPWWLSILWKLHPPLASHVAIARTGNPVIRPKHGTFIITGRGGQHRTATIRWINQHAIGAKLIMTHEIYDDKQRGREWKRDQIKRLGITIFYEDDQKTIDFLRLYFDEQTLRIIRYVA